MSAPAEALAKFWEDLRGKARVEIDHPDLPEALKVAAGQAVHYRDVMCAQSRCQACVSILQTCPKQGVFASLRAKSRFGVPPPQHVEESQACADKTFNC